MTTTKKHLEDLLQRTLTILKDHNTPAPVTISLTQDLYPVVSPDYWLKYQQDHKDELKLRFFGGHRIYELDSQGNLICCPEEE